MDFSTGLYYFLLGSVPPAILIFGAATTEAMSSGRLWSILVGIVTALLADIQIVLLAMQRAKTTPDHVTMMSLVFSQPEVIAFGVGTITVIAIWIGFISYKNLFEKTARID